MSAVREQQKVLPVPRARVVGALSRRRWAMRPQTAMAAVFLVVIGTSFVLVQSRKQVSTASSNAEGMPMQRAAATAAAPMASAYAFDQKETAFAHGVEEKRPTRRARCRRSRARRWRSPTIAKRDKAKDELEKNDSNRITNAGPIGGRRSTTTCTTASARLRRPGPDAHAAG